ncbi:D-alanine--D-alanine ligase [Facklamia miroungae]|uniref:D-alanine--D-alanine ligase n=1 Tax=Facklamia miroungae TaxID=120956 RepID=A0A1G7S4K6_9LACT|nr:D-alanine--D-alanine ligase [Facklamia miroungae]NKZ29181.1 D-alanine--D-alanine ligase [Facklamia miroungae]SDG17389.1 D-alanine-D-alanine ligase [Facklamia miroungae]
MKIILLYGGQSAEHEISIISAHNITQAIMYDLYTVQPIYITKQGQWIKGPEMKEPSIGDQQLIFQESEKMEWSSTNAPSKGILIRPGDIQEKEAIVFPVLHGPNGEDGTVQGFVEVLGMPYVGAGITASANGMDKIISKALFTQAGIPQVPYVSFDDVEWKNQQDSLIIKAEGTLLYPLFVKPANMGSSVGISKAHDKYELIKAVEEALKYDRRIVVEQGITADECEVAVLGNEDIHVSCVGRLVKTQDFYDYSEKYINNTVEMEIPAQLPESLCEQIQEYAKKAYQVIDGSGLARADFFVTSNHDVYINELNTMPGFTQYSMYPSLWKATGLEYRDLIEELIQLGLSRHKTRSQMKSFES